jgi:hypothetical protein
VKSYVTGDSAIGIAQANIETLVKHRSDILRELHITEIDDDGDKELLSAYANLEISFLRAVQTEASRAISFYRSHS